MIGVPGGTAATTISLYGISADKRAESSVSRAEAGVRVQR